MNLENTAGVQAKRQRAKNFSSEEERELVALVEKYKSVIENKKSDAVTWKEKEQAWEKLALNFVSKTGVNRSWKALREKYENMKRISKAELAAEKRETYRTGGGQPAKNAVSSVSERIIVLMGESATGLENDFDSDGQKILQTYSDTEIHTEADKENNISLMDSHDSDLQSAAIIDDANFSENFCNKWNPAQLKQPLAKKLAVNKKARKRTLEEEKLILTKIQQTFFEKENIRADEKHQKEMKALEEKHQKEMQHLHLKNELIQLELAEKKLRLELI